MLRASDLVAAGFPDDLTAAGISVCRESLSVPRRGGGERAYMRFRREIAAVAVALAFRRHLGQQGIAYGVSKRHSFDSAGLGLMIGADRCDINSYLISHPEQVAALEADPRAALAAPALIPEKGRWKQSFSDNDVHIFAMSAGFLGASGIQGENPSGPATPTFLMHLMPAGWARPQHWIRIWPLVLKSESPEELTVELAGHTEAGEFLAQPVRLEGGVRREVESGFWSLTHVHVKSRPSGRIGMNRGRGKRAHVIGPGDWTDVWIHGRKILFLGWMRHFEFRNRAKTVPAGSRVFQFSRTQTANLAVPIAELKPLDQLLEGMPRSSVTN